MWILRLHLVTEICKIIVQNQCYLILKINFNFNSLLWIQRIICNHYIPLRLLTNQYLAIPKCIKYTYLIFELNFIAHQIYYWLFYYKWYLLIKIKLISYKLILIQWLHIFNNVIALYAWTCYRGVKKKKLTAFESQEKLL